jgi:predicted nucleic acid-binding protein
MTANERPTFMKLLLHLGRGEASSIAVAHHRGAVFASDDRAARASAESRQVLVTGTIGLLVAAVRNIGLSIVEADSILGRMIEVGFFAPIQSIRPLI